MSLQVLIIDDDESFRKIVILKLKHFYEDIVITEYGTLSVAREAIHSDSSFKYDLVILDQHLPDGKGTDILNENVFEGMAVLSVSSDDAPDIPGAAITAGAHYFLSKRSVTEKLFEPLIRGIIDRNKLGRELQRIAIQKEVMEIAKAHIGTLRHEINNPLGAVLGAAYLIRNSENSSSDQIKAAELVEKSGNRIKHVLDRICEAMELETELELVDKAKQKVFHIPGDKPWDEEQ